MNIKSEFPETKLSKFGKKFGWLFSPILFLSLLVYTFFAVQRLQVDLDNWNIEKTGYIDIKEISNGDVYFDNVKVGNTSNVLSTDKVGIDKDPLLITVKKTERKDWEKIIKPKEDIVNILYPVMYPKELKFDYSNFNALAIYNSSNPNMFFYEKIEDNKILLYKYYVQRQIFSVLIKNELFADITNFAIKEDLLRGIIEKNIDITSQSLNLRNIYPDPLGRSVLINIFGKRAILINNAGKITTIPIYVPNIEDQVFWSTSGDYIVIKSGKDIFSFETNTNKIALLYRASNDNEQVEIQFLTKASAIFKVFTPTSIDLFENTFQGNNQQKIYIPNVDGLRTNNMKKVYEILERQNIILLQTENNIYLYDLTNSEIKKFNKYDSEEIIYVDPLKQIVITINKKTKNQFRTYSLDYNDSKTFTLEDIEKNEYPIIKSFNHSRNIAIQDSKKIIFADNDGFNSIKYDKEESFNIVLAVKENRTVVFVISKKLPDTTQNNISIKVEKFQN